MQDSRPQLPSCRTKFGAPLPRATRISERSAVAGLIQPPNQVLNRDEDAPRVPSLCAESQCVMRVIDHAHRVLSCMAGVIHRSNGSSMPRIALARQHMHGSTRATNVTPAPRPGMAGTQVHVQYAVHYHTQRNSRSRTCTGTGMAPREVSVGAG